ncbi:unnamed protein product [Rotaria sp. Silwood1]|nr:unnamed protein product [Rotaria sp. Silwood1]
MYTDDRNSNQLYNTIGIKSHGTITFADNKSNRAEFIRLLPDASVMHVKEIVLQKWCHERPSLVISVTGGAKDYNMKPILLRAFRRGLLKVASTTGAWIITGGMNTGIMKLVGEIIQTNTNLSRPIHLIGVATWGCVSSVDQLDVHGANVHYTKPRSVIKGEAPLEPNHTKFIFIDDGTRRKYGGEIAFRASLEKAISGDFFATRPTTNDDSDGASSFLQSEQLDRVPVVLLVVEGGPNTVRTVHQAVVQNCIPAVFFEGTGRCCDLFAKAYHLYRRYHRNFEASEEATRMTPEAIKKHHDNIENKLRDDLKQELAYINGVRDGGNTSSSNKFQKGGKTEGKTKSREADTTDYFALIYECIHTRTNFLNIVSLNSRSPIEPDIDLAVLLALLKATPGSDSTRPNHQRTCEQFRLALEWNRVDIVKNHIMTKDEYWQSVNDNDLFELALIRNQIEFVKLFLDHDFSLTDLFRDHNKLSLLYNSTISSSCKNPLRIIYTDIIQRLIGDVFDVDVALCPYTNSPDTNLNLDNDSETCTCCTRSSGGQHHQNRISTNFSGRLSTATSSDCHMDVDKELFLWSVITGRREFDLLFWTRGKNKVCAALIAVLIYRKRARKENDNRYYRAAEEFEYLAVQILDRFYQINARVCTKAIVRRIPSYGNITWLQLAIKAEAKHFIAQQAVQDVLNNIWFGFIDHREGPMKIMFSTFMLWYSGFLRYHNELVKTIEKRTFLDELLSKTDLVERSKTPKSTNFMEKQTDDIQQTLIDGNINENHTNVDVVDNSGWCKKTKIRIIIYFRNIFNFIRAPYVKYLYNLYSHIIFLSIFSYMILCDFFPLYEFKSDVCGPAHPSEKQDNNNNPSINTDQNITNITTVPYGFQKHDRASITEYILFVWVSTLLCEEFRQVFVREAQTIRNKIASYFAIFWNQLDILAIILFYVGFGLRFLPTAQCFCAARIILSVDLTIWFMRSLDLFAAIKQLGPKLVMIGEMVHDLKFFMLMLTVFILGFGVSSYSLIYGANPFNWDLPRRIIDFAYWQIFGELTSLDIFGHNYRPNGYAVFILLVCYMAIVSILLVNLLIAMFSNTFDRLETDTDRIWKFQRYSLICEYLSRPALPPPLVLFTHFWRCILYISSELIKIPGFEKKYDRHIRRTHYEITLDDKAATTIEIIEDALGDEVYYHYAKIGRKFNEEQEIDEQRIQSPQNAILRKISTLENRIQTLNNQQNHVLEYLECVIDNLKAMSGENIRMSDRRHSDPEDAFEETMIHSDHSRQVLQQESTIDEIPRQWTGSVGELKSAKSSFFQNRTT